MYIVNKITDARLLRMGDVMTHPARDVKRIVDNSDLRDKKRVLKQLFSRGLDRFSYDDQVWVPKSIVALDTVRARD